MSRACFSQPTNAHKSSFAPLAATTPHAVASTMPAWAPCSTRVLTMFSSRLSFRSLSLALLILALVASCSTDTTLEELNMTEDDLYQRAQSHLEAQRYDLAAESLQLMEARFPFGKYAEQSQLD